MLDASKTGSFAGFLCAHVLCCLLCCCSNARFVYKHCARHLFVVAYTLSKPSPRQRNTYSERERESEFIFSAHACSSGAPAAESSRANYVISHVFFYRAFVVCRELAGLARLLRRHECLLVDLNALNMLSGRQAGVCEWSEMCVLNSYCAAVKCDRAAQDVRIKREYTGLS